MFRDKNYISGVWTDAVSGKTFLVTSAWVHLYFGPKTIILG